MRSTRSNEASSYYGILQQSIIQHQIGRVSALFYIELLIRRGAEYYCCPGCDEIEDFITHQRSDAPSKYNGAFMHPVDCCPITYAE